MLRAVVTLLLSFAASSAAAEECPDFGLSSDYLSAFFCNELAEVEPPRTRDIGTDSDADMDDQQIGPEWLALPVVERAWRSDPAKTLLLIERIRAAGGRTVK